MNPRGNAKYNVLSRSLFCWLDSLFCIGVKRSLNEHDLYPCPEEFESQYIYNKFTRHWHRVLMSRKRRHISTVHLLWVLMKCSWCRLLYQYIAVAVQILLYIPLAILLGNLSDYFFMQSPTTSDTVTAYGCVAGIIICSICVSITNHSGFHMGRAACLVSRISLLNAIYDKILTLTQQSIGKIGVGNIINLASNDIHNLDLIFWHYSYALASPIALMSSSILFYYEIGYTGFVATIVIVLIALLQMSLSRFFSKLRLKVSDKTDKRVKVMNEVISGIRVIKMYGWEYAFHRLVSRLRCKELVMNMRAMAIRALQLSSITFITPLTQFALFSTFVATGGELTPRIIFLAILIISSLKLVVIDLGMDSLLCFAQCLVSLKRIKNFLLFQDNPPLVIEDDQKDSLQMKSLNAVNALCLDSIVNKKTNEFGGDEQSDVMIVVDSLTVSWSNDDNPVLENISFTVDKTCPLLAVIGPVGSGKSTLLQCLLHELTPTSGSVTVTGSIAYASQEPWIFSSTLRDNILFGLPFKPDFYNTVIESCALDKDLSQLPERDLTLVGERGLTLSGGQKARVGLARAIYRQADIYLLDDPLSAVDAAVSRHIFERCICDLLSEKCIILVTHQLQYVLMCPLVLSLRDGKMSMYGPPNAIFCVKDESNIDIINELGHNEDEIIQEHYQTDFIDDSSSNEQCLMPVELSAAESEEERAHGRITMKTYYHYIIAGGGYLFTLIVILVFLSTEGLFVVTDWWISNWADCSTVANNTYSTCSLDTSERIGIYGGLNVTLIGMGILRCLLFLVLVLRSSHVLHNKMFKAVLRAPVLFFDTNPIGRVLNRFSKDVGYLDDLLPVTMAQYLIALVRLIAIIITAVVANFYIIIIVAIILTVLFIFRWYFLRMFRDIKRLEALARSPVYSHISATLQGLPTIRAYSMRSLAMDQFHLHHNEHTAAWYLHIVSSRWLQIRVDILSLCFISIFLLLSIPLSTGFDPTLVGLSVTYVLTMNYYFHFCIKRSTDVEGLMISVERVLGYGKLESEASLETVPPQLKPSEEWPTHGCIQLQDLVYKYSTNSQEVLKGISCCIEPTEKIGIVGRTGAGKSSLISALFRLAEPQGSLIIDGVDCLQLGLHDVRKNISVIPQDPVVFSGTVRYNLDPFNDYDDNSLWTAIEQVQLRSVIESLEGQLDGIVAERGSNFSVGQRQLICLARALLRHNKILVLDEATANVDLETDAIIQQVIRLHFSECTILTIAHRLDTVMDSDRIMVLKSGELCEFDVPHQLLSNEESHLLQLVQHTGPITSEKLKDMAKDNYDKKKKLLK